MSDHILKYKFKAFNFGIPNLPRDQKYKIDHTRAKQLCKEIVQNKKNYNYDASYYIERIHVNYQSFQEFIEAICKTWRGYIKTFPLRCEILYDALESEEKYIKEKYGKLYDKDYLFEFILNYYVVYFRCESMHLDIIDNLYFGELNYKIIVEKRNDENDY